MPLGHVHTVFGIAATIIRVLKSEPSLIADLILLSLPKAKRYEGDSQAWGKCALCPEGLPLVTSVNEGLLKSFLHEVGEDSRVSVDQKQRINRHAVAKRAAAVKDRNQPPKKKAKKQAPAPVAEPIDDELKCDEEETIDTKAT